MSKSANVIFYIFEFRKGINCVHTQTHIHTYIETDKLVGMGKILSISLLKLLEIIMLQLVAIFSADEKHFLDARAYFTTSERIFKHQSVFSNIINFYLLFLSVYKHLEGCVCL